jgi:hypothetical protein
MVHAFIVGALGFWVLFIEKKLDMECSETATDLSTITIAISAGYFLWDSIVVLLRYDLFGFLFALHGIYCLYVYAVATFVRSSEAIEDYNLDLEGRSLTSPLLCFIVRLV